MGNFKRDSAGGKAAGQMCEGNGNRGGRNGNRDEALHAVTPGRYVDLTLDAGFKAVFADRGNKELLIGLLNEIAPGLPLSVQAMLGAAIISTSEMLVGLVVNRWLGLGVWDYSGVRGNLLGQVCLPFFTAWMPLSAFAAVADDFLRLLVFHEPFPPISLF